MFEKQPQGKKEGRKTHSYLVEEHSRLVGTASTKVLRWELASVHAKDSEEVSAAGAEWAARSEGKTSDHQ